MHDWYLMQTFLYMNVHKGTRRLGFTIWAWSSTQNCFFYPYPFNSYIVNLLIMMNISKTINGLTSCRGKIKILSRGIRLKPNLLFPLCIGKNLLRFLYCSMSKFKNFYFDNIYVKRWGCWINTQLLCKNKKIIYWSLLLHKIWPN